MNEVINNMKEIFGKFVSEYSRFQAIEDGILIDVSDPGRETGFTIPIAVTCTVWNDYIAVPEEMKGFQDERGRLHDLLWMLYCAIKSKEIRGSQGYFELIIAIPEENKWQSYEKRYCKDRRLVTLKSVCGPDDDGKACITIFTTRRGLIRVFFFFLFARVFFDSGSFHIVARALFKRTGEQARRIIKLGGIPRTEPTGRIGPKKGTRQLNTIIPQLDYLFNTAFLASLEIRNLRTVLAGI